MITDNGGDAGYRIASGESNHVQMSLELSSGTADYTPSFTWAGSYKSFSYGGGTVAGGGYLYNVAGHVTGIKFVSTEGAITSGEWEVIGHNKK
jgi:hypothetical protein